MLCFSGVGNENPLNKDFMRESMCVKLDKNRLSERLSTCKEESLVGVMEEDLLQYAASFHVFSL